MKKKFLQLRILTPEGILLEVNALESINAPLADNCPIGIRPGHAPLIAETKSGEVRYQGTDRQGMMELHAGILEIRDDSVVILTPGEISFTPQEISQTSETEYDRLMNTIIENYHLAQD